MTLLAFKAWLEDGDTTKPVAGQVSKYRKQFSLSQSRMTEQFQRAYFHCHTIEASNLFWGSGGDGEVVDLQDGQVMKYTRRGGMVSCEGARRWN